MKKPPASEPTGEAVTVGIADSVWSVERRLEELAADKAQKERRSLSGRKGGAKGQCLVLL